MDLLKRMSEFDLIESEFDKKDFELVKENFKLISEKLENKEINDDEFYFLLSCMLHSDYNKECSNGRNTIEALNNILKDDLEMLYITICEIPNVYSKDETIDSKYYDIIEF